MGLFSTGFAWLPVVFGGYAQLGHEAPLIRRNLHPTTAAPSFAEIAADGKTRFLQMGNHTVSRSSFKISLEIAHTIEGALEDFSCMFSFVPEPGGAFVGAYRQGNCLTPGDNLVVFHARGLHNASRAEDVEWLYREPSVHGEDPRCFLWQETPVCFTWDHGGGPYRLLLFEGSGPRPRTVELDQGFAEKIGGKNWIPVADPDGTLYFVVALDPLKVLRYNGEHQGMGRLSWHHSDSRKSNFTWRGGTPAAFFETRSANGFVGLGHHSVNCSNHKVFGYVLAPDLHSVQLLGTEEFFLPRDGPLGVWDPLSIWQADSDGALPRFGAVVTYWNNLEHLTQRTHLVSFTLSTDA